MFHYTQISGQPRQRHWLTALLAAVPTVAGALPQGNAQDQARFQTAQNWYSAAINGDKDALKALQFMSGRFGASTCGQYGACSGFATQAAKDYSYKLYQQAAAVLAGQQPQATPIPVTPPVTPNPLSTTAVEVLGGKPQPLTPSQQVQQTNRGLLLLLGVVVVGGAILVWVTRRGR